MDLEARCKIKNKDGFKPGYSEIVSKESNPEMLMTFGILKMMKNEEYFNNNGLERLYILLTGSLEINFDEKTHIITRGSIHDEDPYTLDLSKGIGLKIKCISEETEIALFTTENDKDFESKLYGPEQLVKETRGKGTMNETGTRLVKTIMDKSISDDSNFMLGEDVHYPGKWAGFPSHSHNQPEIYFYRFLPENGFGLMRLGDQGVCLEENDTVVIPPDLVHPQVAAPGYAMYFLWVIRHLKGNPYLGPDFEEQHLWVERPDAKIWPDR